MKISELDIFYISYDEPNAEEHWADLLSKAPWAQRVHGVQGFDNAHKECARLSSTDRFITVDADNIVREEFFNEVITQEQLDSNCVLSWSGKNYINGLVYGNGGIKCWPKSIVQNMKTHENAEVEEAKLDFCWQLNYTQMDKIYSDVYPNGSPFQAFRSGFREGCKMTLNEGKKIKYKDVATLTHRKNYERLLIWCSVGMDVENGVWAIYGACLGCYMTNLSPWDINLLSDYTWFNLFWKEDISKTFQGDDADEVCLKTKYKWKRDRLILELDHLQDILKMNMNIDLTLLYPDQSKFFKAVYHNPSRTS